MKPFFKAVGHSLRYRWTILGAFICSLIIAVIWSASITTVFPIVKIVLEGETAITWVEHEIENGERNLLAVKNEVLALENCLLYTSPSPRDKRQSRMPSSA